MKRIILLLACLAATAVSFAQVNIAAFQDAHTSGAAMNYLPTYLGDGFRSVQISLFNPYATVGSNFTAAKDVRDYISSDQVTTVQLDRTLDKLKNHDNNLHAGLNVSILNIQLNIPIDKGGEVFSLGFGVNEHVEMNTVFNKELFSLAYKGNKQYAGQTINLAPRVNALAYVDYGVTAAFNLKLGSSGIGIKPAIRLRYLSGQASIQTIHGSNIDMYTDPNGRYLDFTTHYTVNTSMSGNVPLFSSSEFGVNNKTLRQGAGYGFGMDLGIRVTPIENLSVNLGVTDIGSIRFTRSPINMYSDSSFRYEGQEVNFTDNEGFRVDSLAAIANPNYTYRSYSVQLPTKLLLTASLGLGKQQKKGVAYYKNLLNLTYVQGFANYLSSVKAPYVAVGYTHSFNNVLNLGVNAGAGGAWGGSLGALASVKFGGFCIGVNSNNLIPLIAPRSGKGTDAGLVLLYSL